MIISEFEFKIVMPTEVGIHCAVKNEYLDSRFRGNDKLRHYPKCSEGLCVVVKTPKMQEFALPFETLCPASLASIFP